MRLKYPPTTQGPRQTALETKRSGYMSTSLSSPRPAQHHMERFPPSLLLFQWGEQPAFVTLWITWLESIL